MENLISRFEADRHIFQSQPFTRESERFLYRIESESFTAPVTAESIYRKWTVGPVFYSVVAVAEALGRSGKAQVVDLHTNDGNVYTPGYAIYDNGVLAKVALFNFVSDPSGASKYTATISVAGAGVPASVSVKYLLADSVSNKFNVTWAGQVRAAFGSAHRSD